MRIGKVGKQEAGAPFTKLGKFFSGIEPSHAPADRTYLFFDRPEHRAVGTRTPVGKPAGPCRACDRFRSARRSSKLSGMFVRWVGRNDRRAQPERASQRAAASAFAINFRIALSSPGANSNHKALVAKIAVVADQYERLLTGREKCLCRCDPDMANRHTLANAQGLQGDRKLYEMTNSMSSAELHKTGATAPVVASVRTQFPNAKVVS